MLTEVHQFIVSNSIFETVEIRFLQKLKSDSKKEKYMGTGNWHAPLWGNSNLPELLTLPHVEL